mgnify:CR=1 FL=1
MAHSLLTIQNLKAWYSCQHMVLSDFSLNILPHEAVGLIGLNGAGKTTFFKILSGLLTTYRANQIQFRGRPIGFRDRDFKLFRYTVFAEDHSFPYFTFREYLSYVFAAYRKNIPDISKLLQGFHFEDYTDVLLKDLSTGNRKKAFLITGFALKPDLLLLDEPVGTLDFQSTEYLYQQMDAYKEYGTVLFSSHILESITLTCDRVCVLNQGMICQTFEGRQIQAADIREALRYERNVSGFI